MNQDNRLLPGYIAINHPEFIIETYAMLEAAVSHQRDGRASGHKYGVALDSFKRWAVVDVEAYKKANA